jgi:hypothetical protein
VPEAFNIGILRLGRTREGGIASSEQNPAYWTAQTLLRALERCLDANSWPNRRPHSPTE